MVAFFRPQLEKISDPGYCDIINATKKHIKKIAVAGVAIKKSNKYLLVQEKKKKVYGLWNIPAGRVRASDTVEETAVREAKEETGYDVKLIDKLGILLGKRKISRDHIFIAEVIGGKIKKPLMKY